MDKAEITINVTQCESVTLHTKGYMNYDVYTEDKLKKKKILYVN